MAQTLKKIIGNKEEEMSTEKIYYKLDALRIAQRLMMETGDAYCDKIIFGLDCLFSDVLTELDQAFLDGDMEASPEEVQDED